MKIGNVKFDSIAALAPMAGTADTAFRELCLGYGAAFVVSEMVSSKALSFNDKKSKSLMQLSDKERPASIQIFGSSSKLMANAAVCAMQFLPQMIDINMGCPAPKVTSNGCGSYLMTNPKLCYDIVKAVKSSVDIPVTVKIRKGWDDNSINALEVATLCEKAGADALTIHGRTRQQMYHDKVDLDIIKQVKKELDIPVIGNGDIVDAISAANMLEYTGCDMIMVGRGALGNPWIFREIDIYNKTDKLIPPIGINEKISVMVKHIESLCEHKGEYIGMKEARKHIGWYLKGLNNAACLRNEAGKLNTLEEFYKLAVKIHQYNS